MFVFVFLCWGTFGKQSTAGGYSASQACCGCRDALGLDHVDSVTTNKITKVDQCAKYAGTYLLTHLL